MMSQELLKLSCVRCRVKHLLQTEWFRSHRLNTVFIRNQSTCTMVQTNGTLLRTWKNRLNLEPSRYRISYSRYLSNRKFLGHHNHGKTFHQSAKCDTYLNVMKSKERAQCSNRRMLTPVCDKILFVRNKSTGKESSLDKEDPLAKLDKFVEEYERKNANNRFKDGLTTTQAFAIGVTIFGIYYFFFRPERTFEEPQTASNTTVTLYRKMPLKSMSRVWGKMTCWELPESLRVPLLGLYCRMFGVQMHEAEEEDLKKYKCLNELFRRKLKPDARIVDPHAPVTSPADGRILHFGKVENGIVEQVKGVNYSIQGFLGPQLGDEDRIKPLKDEEYQQNMNIKPGNDLYNCIIYLAPGDYHRFHSSCDWKILHRRHFPGELLSVNPGIARWVQGLFNLNERAVYSGSWKHGYFSYTAVGATNVGSIKIYFDENLITNIGPSHPNHVYHDTTFTDAGHPEGIHIAKGEMLGEFNLGSTIVLLFEAPKNFQFSVEPGQKVKFGESLGAFMN